MRLTRIITSLTEESFKVPVAARFGVHSFHVTRSAAGGFICAVCYFAMKMLCLGFLCVALSCPAEKPRPPVQPESGPGGRACPHTQVRKLGPFGTEGKAFWIYEPASPAPVTAPVIVFLHGYLGVDAKMYGGWIDHLARRGNIVIFPVYQASLWGAGEYTGNALAAVKEAFRILRHDPGHVRPDEKNNFAIVGHSLGCLLGANLAAMAQEEGLPRPKALMACHAGDANSVVKALPTLLRSPDKIPDLLMLVVVGSDDRFIGDSAGREIFFLSTGVQPKNKNLILIRSDEHGSPTLEATHFAPLSLNEAYASGGRMTIGLRGDELPGPLRAGLASRKMRDTTTLPPGFGRIDALDFYGYWKWFDALTDAAFYGKNRNMALGDTEAQKFMGTWSDGTPVNPAQVELPKE